MLTLVAGRYPVGRPIDEADEALDRAALFLTQRIRAAGGATASA
jgi:hypothetical protein